jgi:hypothetical protein
MGIGNNMTEEKIKIILENHRKWLANEEDGFKANLCEADLHGANLLGANLCKANLFEAKTDKPLIIFQANRHFAYCHNGVIKIGCESKTISEWFECFNEIGEREKYSDQEIKLYGDYIKLCAENYRE